MDITVRSNNRGREILVSGDADWTLFDELAGLISTKLESGQWVERLDGLDERYWDYRVGSAVVTLHLQQYLGIMLFSSERAEDQVGSEEIIDRIATILATYQPHRSQA